MPGDKWTLNKTGAKIAAGWEPKGKDKVAQDNWNKFQNLVKQGNHPKDAATKAGLPKAKYKEFKNTKKGVDGKHTIQAEVYLSQSERATFVVDYGKKEISKIQLGGHT
jgi:hypothetical protein